MQATTQNIHTGNLIRSNDGRIYRIISNDGFEVSFCLGGDVKMSQKMSIDAFDNEEFNKI